MTERYMIVTYIKKPNGQWDEITEFKNNLKTRYVQTAKVILDFKEKKCVVNSLNKEAGYDDMLEFYKRQLGDQLTPYLPKDQESP
jgi:hypothetical protein